MLKTIIAGLIAVNGFAAIHMIDAQMRASKAFGEARAAAIEVAGRAAQNGVVLDYERLLP